jgi:uncharacterized membrane protein YfcA
MLIYLLVLVIGLIAGTISGVIGTGSSILLLPVLVYSFGPKQAIPIMGIAAIMANVAKVFAWWREINWPAFFAYSVTGIPASALGARTLLLLPSRVVDIVLGIFFIVMVPIRHWLNRRNFKVRLWQLAVFGAVIGFLTGIVVSTGPLSVPAFTFYGLVKGSFLATEAASSLAIFVSKVITFGEMGALPTDAIIKGVITGASLMLGAFLGKAVVVRISPNFFRLLLDCIMIVSGVTMLVASIT